MSKTGFGRNIIFLLVVNLLIKPFYLFGIEAQAQNIIGPNSWGVYFGLFNFCFLFQIILDPGLHNQNTKWIAENRQAYTQRIGQTIGLKLILALCFLIAIAIGGWLVGYTAAYFNLLILLALYFFLNSFYVFIKSHFPALGKYSYETIFSVLDKLILIFILGFQIYVLRDISMEHFIFSLITANAIALIIALICLREFGFGKLAFNFSKSKEILGQSLGFALIALFMNLYNRMDGVMLERMLDDGGYASGVYAAGYRIFDAANMSSLLFASLLLPMFANLLSKKESTYSLMSDASKLMIVLVTSVSVIGFFYSEQIMQWIYVDYKPLYSESFKYLILGFIGVGLSYVFGTLITASGKLFAMNVLLFCGILLNWTLNLQLIPEETSLGAAKATLITQWFVMFAQFFLVVKNHAFKWDFLLIFRILLFVGLSLILGHFSLDFELHWLIKVGLLGIIFIIASFLLRLIRLDIFYQPKL